MAIAGIEGLAQGFMQGMAIKRQNDRQDVLDAQNLEKFGMDKERFATQQAASAFDLQNAQTNAANAAIDRTRALGIQKKGDEFEANLGRILSAGSPEGELVELEKVYQGSGVKGAWARDPKTGGLAKNADGTFKWVNEDGTAYDAKPEDAIGRYIAKVDPKGEFTRKRTQQDELAKEERAAKRSDAIAARDDKYATKRLYTADAIADGNEKPEKETPLSAADFKNFFGEDYEISTDANGLTKMGNRINRALQNRFLTWASVNKRKATMSAYQDWVANDPAAQSLASPNKNQNIIGVGILKGYAAPDTSGGAGVDVSDFNSANQVNAGGNPQKPTGLSIPKVTATATYDKTQRLSKNMRSPDYQKYTESMPNEIPVEATQKTDMDGGLYYELLASKKYPSPPDGFMRKSNNYRSPDYNVFVSNSTGFASSN